MKLYKQFICNELADINQEVLSYIDTLKLGAGFWNPVDIRDFIQANPKFKQWILANNLAIKSIAVTQGLDPNCCGPHIDTPPSVYKLSWPVLNTEKTFNRWYIASCDCPTKTNSFGGINYLDSTKLIEIDRMRVDAPAIIATGVPHDVLCESDAKFPRLGLQCQLFNEPTAL